MTGKLADVAIKHGHVAGVIGHTFILLVGTFMFFIDDDEAEIGPRQKQCRTCTYDNPRAAFGNAAPDAFTFARPQIRMPACGLAIEALFDACQECRSECDFRQQQQAPACPAARPPPWLRNRPRSCRNR